MSSKAFSIAVAVIFCIVGVDCFYVGKTLLGVLAFAIAALHVENVRNRLRDEVKP